MLFNLTCKHCENPFTRTAAAVRQGRSVYCSPTCQANARQDRLEVTCERCGVVWKIKRSKAAAARFCSRECRHASDRGKHPHNYQGIRRFERGYIITNHPSGGRVYEHRLVMEQKLDRELLDSEHVHHIDGNRANNDPANLMLVSRSEHNAIHRGISTWARNFDACIVCGTIEIPHDGHGRCKRCNARVRLGITSDRYRV